MGLPHRNESGFSSSRHGDPLYGFGFLDPFKFCTWFTDFLRSEGLGATTANDWTVTKAGTGAPALADADGGVIAITNSAADNDNFFVQKVGEAWKWEAAKKLVIMGRFKVSDATLSQLVFGLQITDTTPLDVTDGIFFIKAKSSTTLVARVEKNDVGQTLNAVTMADDTYVDVAIVYRGQPRSSQGPTGVTSLYDFEVYAKSADVHGDVVWQQVGTITCTTEAPDDEVLTLSFGVQNGEGVAKVMSLDYILVAKER